MQVAIICGGKAMRLGNLCQDIPKSLIPIAGRPFISYQLEMLAKQGVKDIILCVGYLGDCIAKTFGNGEKYGVSLTYSFENRPLGTAGALKNAEKFLGDCFFTLYGDSYVFLDFGKMWREFRQYARIGMMAVYHNRNQIETSNTEIGGGEVLKYDKYNHSPDMEYIEYGVNIFNREVLGVIPQDKSLGLDKILSGLATDGELLAYEVSHRYYEIGSPQGLAEFESIVTKGRYEL